MVVITIYILNPDPNHLKKAPDPNLIQQRSNCPHEIKISYHVFAIETHTTFGDGKQNIYRVKLNSYKMLLNLTEKEHDL